MSNLVFLGRPSTLPRSFLQFKQTQKRREFDFRQKLVKKAIYKHCSPDLADKSINWWRRSKGGPQDIEIDFKKTNRNYFPVKRDYHYLRALRVVERLFRPSRKLHPIAYPDLRYYPWTLSVSAEAPYSILPRYQTLLREKHALGEIVDSRTSFHNLYNEIFDENRPLIHLIKTGDPKFWNPDGTPKPYYFTTLHARSHLVPADASDKLRAVFGLPKLFLQAENMFIWNLQREYLNNINSPMLWGYETMKGGWRKLFNRSSHKRYNSVLSIDWSGFDRRALHEIIDDVHSIWRSWFDFSAYEPTVFYPNSKPDPQEIERLWYWMTDLVKHYPILTPTGKLYKWNHNGIASGFMQTQLLDSFVNSVMILTSLSSCGVDIDSPNFQLFVQGDDSLCLFPEMMYDVYGQRFLEMIAIESRNRFDAKLSTKKSRFTRSLIGQTVLHYDVDLNGCASRDPSDLLGHLLYPEHPQTLSATASAAIGIAQASMGQSREVYNTCKDVYDFIVSELGTKIKYSNRLYTERERLNLPPLPKYFPTFDEIYSQNFSLAERTYSECQRTWPTDSTSSGGFYFLNN